MLDFWFVTQIMLTYHQVFWTWKHMIWSVIMLSTLATCCLLLFFPQVKMRNLFFSTAAFIFMVSWFHMLTTKTKTKLDLKTNNCVTSPCKPSPSSTHTKIARTRCGNKGNRQMQWHMAAWSMLVWNAVRRMLEIAPRIETDVFFVHGQKSTWVFP